MPRRVSTRGGKIESFLAAFPDLRMEPVDVLECGDKVVPRVKVTGTNEGEFLGGPATGKAIDVQLIDIIRVGDDGSRTNIGGHGPADDAAAAGIGAGGTTRLIRTSTRSRPYRRMPSSVAKQADRPSTGSGSSGCAVAGYPALIPRRRPSFTRRNRDG
jgi:hypothetical protein